MYLGYVSLKFDKTHFKFHNDSLKGLNKPSITIKNLWAYIIKLSLSFFWKKTGNQGQFHYLE